MFECARIRLERQLDWLTGERMRSGQRVAVLVTGGWGGWCRIVAGQLGYSKPSTTQDEYLGRKPASPADADTLELAAVKPSGGLLCGQSVR
jgi:hypothetical protein